jgi:HPt (histidine-containing phosphotransfer) domain-containing protein
MVKPAIKRAIDKTAAVPEAPAGAIDRAHLARMTFGDRSLERELLHLFDRQAAILIGRMQSGDAAAVGALAHTLKGSAAGIGAGRVAHAAAAVEQATTSADRAAAIQGLAQAVMAARKAIAEILAGEVQP